MKKTVIVLGLAVVVALGVTYVYAGGRSFGPGKGSGNRAGGWRLANLTSEQQTKIQELRQQHQKEVAPIREKMASLRQELRTLWSDPKADPTVIEAKTKEMNDLRNQIQDKRLHMRLESRNLLSPDQIEALAAGRGQGEGSGRGQGRGRR